MYAFVWPLWCPTWAPVLNTCSQYSALLVEVVERCSLLEEGPGPTWRVCSLASFPPAFFPLLAAIKDVISKCPAPASMTLDHNGLCLGTAKYAWYSLSYYILENFFSVINCLRPFRNSTIVDDLRHSTEPLWVRFPSPFFLADPQITFLLSCLPVYWGFFCIL